MTRDEAIERLKTDIYKYTDFTENPNENEFWMAFDMAIKALEHPERNVVAIVPCGNTISRQAVMDCFKKWQPYMATRMWEFEKELNELPPVNPQEPKTGRWINTETNGVRYPFWCRYKCSLCGGLSDRTNFCPNCGCRMVDPQESDN